MDPDQTAWMRRLVWTHAGRKRTVDFVMARLICEIKLKAFLWHNGPLNDEWV
jgi:hypothetical protein